MGIRVEAPSRRRRRRGALTFPLLAGASLLALSQPAISYQARAAGVPTLEKIPEVEVVGQSENLIGTADTATQGTVLKEQIEERPVYRVGELLETVPGLIVTQHSGEGKANQYFLRGFNLDHGTDVEINFDDVPVNLRTHAHGQGYADLNFLIPELIGNIQYSKGPYFAAGGEFDTAGSVHINLIDKLDHDIAAFSMGTLMDDRAFGAMSRKVGEGNLLAAAEYSHLDGPWTIPDDFNKGNAFLRYSVGDSRNGYSVTGFYSQDQFHATNQVSAAAVNAGAISPFDAIDKTDSGLTERWGLSTKFQHTTEDSQFKANLYVQGYNFHLFNNFDYFLNSRFNPPPGPNDVFTNANLFTPSPDPNTPTDQFRQAEQRHYFGGAAAYTSFDRIFGLETENTAGFQFRSDEIHSQLQMTQNAVPWATVRADSITETSGGLYVENKTHWLEKFRSVVGLRQDIFYASVSDRGATSATSTATSPIAANSGTTAKGLFSPKGSFVFGPWGNTEFYLSAGQGFHSNDARGALSTRVPFFAQGVDPASWGTPQLKTPLLTRANGYEIGVRTSFLPHLQSSAALFDLDIANETLFDGDTGQTTSTGRPSRRLGIEISNFYTPFSWLIVDADFTFTRARFTNFDPVGSYVPEAAKVIAAAGVTVTNLGPWEGGLRFRYFGPRPLIEDGSVRSGPTTLVDLRVGYKFTDTVTASVDIYNIFDSHAHQIDYYYASQYSANSATAGNSIHYHQVEPPSARFTLKMTF